MALTLIQGINEVLRKCGRRIVSKVDPAGEGGTSTAAYAEAALEEATRAVASEGWSWNYKTNVSLSASDIGDGTFKFQTSSLGETEVYHIDSSDDSENPEQWVDHGGILYNVTDNTDVSSSGASIKVKYYFNPTFAKLPTQAQQYAIAKAALNLNRSYYPDTGREQVIAAEMQQFRATMQQEEIRASDVNVLDTTNMQQIRGRNRMANRSIY